MLLLLFFLDGMGWGLVVILEVSKQVGLGVGRYFRMLRLNQDPRGGTKEGWVRGMVKPTL